MLRRLMIAVLCVVCLATPARGYVLPVTDVAVWIKNLTTRIQTELHALLQEQQQLLVLKMSRRISEYIGNVRARYGIKDDDPPRWRIHDFESDRYEWGREYLAALNYGDPSGTGFARAARPVTPIGSAPADLSPAARDALARASATVDLGTAFAVSGAHQAGLIRYNGRALSTATNLFEADALNQDTTESATAALDKLNASAVVELKQKATRNQLLVAVLELALLENVRRRNAEVIVMNQRLSAASYYRSYSRSFFTQDAAVAAAAWRQP